jgi:hypothetical protein
MSCHGRSITAGVGRRTSYQTRRRASRTLHALRALRVVTQPRVCTAKDIGTMKFLHAARVLCKTRSRVGNFPPTEKVLKALSRYILPAE